MFTIRWRWLPAFLALFTFADAAKADLLWGVNGHPLISYPGVSFEEQLDYVKDLGMRSYRVNVSEAASIPDLVALVAEGKKRGIEILPVITPPLELDKETEADLYRKAFDLAVALVKPLKNDVRVWELGNEMENFAILQPCETQDDGAQYNCAWGPAGGISPLEYYGPRWRKVSAVLKGLSEGAMSVDPSIRKAMGTAGWGHVGAFKRMEEDGIKWDISVWHMYGEDPEWAFKTLAEFKRPIWVTEMNHPYGSQKGEEAQAAGLKRWMGRLRQLKDAYHVEAVHLYELLDETYWAPDFEAYMGLVRLKEDGKGGWRTAGPKPAYHAVREAILRGPEPATGSISPLRNCDLANFDASDPTARNQMAYSFCLVLGRMADGGGLEGWTLERKRGLSIPDTVGGMLQSEEFEQKHATSGLGNEDFVTLIYRLLLDRDPDGGGRDDYLAQLEAGSLSRIGLAKSIAGSDEFRARHPLLAAAPRVQ